MWLLPFQSIRYSTQRSPADVLHSLQEVVSDYDVLDRSRRAYCGNVGENSFLIRPKLGFSRNSVVPYASGRISATAKGSEVQVFFYPHPIGLVMVGVLIAGFSFKGIFAGAIVASMLFSALMLWGFINEAEQLERDILGFAPPDGADPKPSWTR